MRTIHHPDYQLFAVALRHARVKAGLTQQDLADHLGKPQSHIAKVELGERILDVREFAVICGALNIKPATLLRVFET
jgi:transcriptional regulator with XRE-family HTH domain